MLDVHLRAMPRDGWQGRVVFRAGASDMHGRNVARMGRIVSALRRPM